MFSTALIIATIGGLNWGLIALFDFNLVAALFGTNTVLTNVTYFIVGLAAAYALIVQIMRIVSTTQAESEQRENRRPAYSNR